MSDLNDIIARNGVHAFNSGVEHGQVQGHNLLYRSLMEGIEKLKAEGTIAVSVDYMTRFINHGGYLEEKE